MLKIKRLHPDVILPRRATTQSIGLDLYAHLLTETGRPNTALIPPRNTRAIPTGLIVIPPPGMAVYVCSRSGLAKSLSMFVTNAPGVIDPDYRGELFVLLYNGGLEAQYVRNGDRVGQIILLPATYHDLVEVDELDVTERGAAGFGSTGR